MRMELQSQRWVLLVYFAGTLLIRFSYTNFVSAQTLIKLTIMLLALGTIMQGLLVLLGRYEKEERSEKGKLRLMEIALFIYYLIPLALQILYLSSLIKIDTGMLTNIILIVGTILYYLFLRAEWKMTL